MLNSTISQKRLISLKANLFLCPPDVPAMPFKRSHREHVTGYQRTSDGQPLPVQWETSAQFTNQTLGNTDKIL